MLKGRFRDGLACRLRAGKLRFCVSILTGVECSLGGWSPLTSVGPAARQDHSMVWDAATQSALMFGGQAGNMFLYFDDLWRYSVRMHSWANIAALGPRPRYGHTAVWDSHSSAMLVLGGKHVGEVFKELWQFTSGPDSWELLSPPSEPRARAYHSAAWDDGNRAMIVFGGEDGEILSDLQRYSVVANSWAASTAVGPEGRMRHTAVWDGVTGSMLLLGGWNGVRYLSDLWRYDGWSARWFEPSVAGPLPRAGHAAAWDPVSLSLKVFGGVQNASSSLSYDAGLCKYNLLVGWTQLQPDPLLPSPSGRSDMAMVWDATSRSLLVFGGVNGTYIGDTWRYVASPTTAPPIVRCRLGQPCLLDLSSNTSRLTVKSCDSDAQPAADVNAPRLLDAEPGTYYICQCGVLQNCNQTAEFSEVAGLFIAEGPFANQSAQCFLGFTCKIDIWKGVGISTDDKLVLRKTCGSGTTTAYSGSAVLIQLNEPTHTFSLDLGRLADGEPEDVEICWCPASSSCASSEDFAVVALKLQILCPPGQYQTDTGCQPCPEDHYCAGGSTKLKCPVGSTALIGSSLVLRTCEHIQGCIGLVMDL